MTDFVKHRADAPAGFFAAEAAGLQWLSAVEGGVPCAQVIAVDEASLTLRRLESVSPTPEAALKAHPDVFDALVVGVPDHRYGQHVAAVVQPRPGARPALSELDSFVRSEIAGYKVPRSLWLVDEVKRSPAGKPDYRWAKEQTEARPADDVHAAHATA